MRPLLVGEAPSRTSDPARPFSGRSGARLARLMDVEQDELSAYFELVNLFEEYPGLGSGKGTAWDPVAAAARARLLVVTSGRFTSQRDVVCVGKRVLSAVVGIAGWPYFDWLHGAGPWRRVAHIPHPSGINPWWNDAGHLAQASAFLRSLRRAC